MLDRIKIHPFIKLIITILLLLIIALTNSIILYIILTLLSFILILISGMSVKEFVSNIKNLCFVLIFLFLIYIIILKSESIFFAFYKIMLVFVVLEFYIVTTSFDELDYANNCLIKPLKIIKININKISFNISTLIYLYTHPIIKIKNKDFFPKSIIFGLITLGSKIDEFKVSLKMKFYRVKKVKYGIIDFVFLAIFIMFFVATIFKEVIF